MVGLLGGAASLWLGGGGHGRLELHGARARRRSGGGLDSRTEKIAEKEKTRVDQILIFFRSRILGIIGDELLFLS